MGLWLHCTQQPLTNIWYAVYVYVPVGGDVHMCQVVARYGTLGVLKYVRKKGILPWDERGFAISDAASA